MDTSNWRPNQGGSANGGDSSMESGDWRSQLEADTRQRILNKIMDRLKRHLPYSGAEGLQELNRKAVRFEEKIYAAATSKFDYLRKIALNMLYLEHVSQNPMRDAMQSYSTASGVNPSGPGSNSMIRQEMDTSNWRPSEGGSAGGGMQFYDWRSQVTPDSRQRIVNRITDTLKRHLPFSRDEGLEELHAIAGRFEEKIFAAATSQPDYLRIISLKMTSMMENRQQNPMPYAMQSCPTANSLNPSDPVKLSMAGTSRPSSSSNPPQGSQIMPRRVRECIEEAEEEIKKLEAQMKQKETEKRQIQKSINEKNVMIRSIKKDIREEKRKVSLIDAEFPMIDEELRDKYILVAQLNALYSDDP